MGACTWPLPLPPTPSLDLCLVPIILHVFTKLMPRYHRTHKTIAFQTPDSVCRFALPCITIWSGFEIYLIYNYTQPTVGYHVLTAWAACILLIVGYFSGYERGKKMQSAILGKREHNYGK